jgi:hypothetical protein
MKGAKGEAYLGIGFESTRGGEKDNVGWFEGIFGWKEDTAVVVSSLEVCSVGSSDGKVPVKEGM